MIHKAVLQKEVLEYLDIKPNENFIDCTIGEGGHTLAILEENKPNGKVLGIDQDLEILKKIKFQDRLILVNDSYINLKKIVEKYNFERVHPVRGQRVQAEAQRNQTSNGVHGILFDLGMSSWHLEKSGRGFTFLKDEPLDMRYNPKVDSLTAQEIINHWSESGIEKILKEYGEERFSRRIAREITKERQIKPIKTTFQLKEVVNRAVPPRYRHRRTPRRSGSATLRGRHCATKTFQALRIAVNDELNNLKKVLPQVIEVLGPGGRIVIISFHSLEDRIVKNFFRDSSQLKIITKKPIRPSQEELKLNRRARSAKLRAAVKNEPR